jgi:hypothetical protein
MTITHLGAKRLQGIKSDRVSDSLGSSAGGTNNGVTLDTSNKKLGTACYSFDGTDDYVVLTDVGTNGIDTTGDLSIVCWINLNVTNANQAIISNDSNSSSAGINLYVHSSNQLRFAGGSAGTQVTGATSKFTASTWYHVAVVKSGANCSLYVDGVQDGSTQTDWGTIDGQAQATIGAQYSGSAYGDDFNGKIDDLAIYKRALTTTEITALYNSGTGALVSSLSNKANLKANYTMDSTSLGATGTTTTTTSGATQQGAQSGSNQTTAHVTSGSNTGLKFTSTYGGTGAAVGTFDLGSALASKWIAQVSFTTGSGYTASGNGMFAFGLSDKGTYSSIEHMNTNSSGDTVNWIYHVGDNSTNDRKDRIRTILNGTGSDGTASAQHSWENSTTYYYEMSYDGSTVTAQRKTDDTYATNHSNGAVTKSTSGITGLQYFNWGSTDNGGSQGGFNVTLNTLKIYDGISSNVGCKNDASTTSELDGMTNLPVNTIFEQTNDTPKYYWKQSDGTWSVGA